LAWIGSTAEKHLGRPARIAAAGVSTALFVGLGAAVWGGLGAAVVVGVIAGLYPAARAARLPPPKPSKADRRSVLAAATRGRAAPACQALCGKSDGEHACAQGVDPLVPAERRITPPRGRVPRAAVPEKTTQFMLQPRGWPREHSLTLRDTVT